MYLVCRLLLEKKKAYAPPQAVVFGLQLGVSRAFRHNMVRSMRVTWPAAAARALVVRCWLSACALRRLTCRSCAACSRVACRRRPLSTWVLVVFFRAPATPAIYTLSLHDALPIYLLGRLLE